MKPGYAAKCKTPSCPENVFLPEPSHQQSFQAQPYWPTGTWPLLFVCPQCRQASVFRSDDFRQENIPNPTEGEDDEALWYIEVCCSESNCGLLVRLHTMFSLNGAPEIVATHVLVGLEKHTCTNGHRLSLPIRGKAQACLIP